MSVIIGIYGLQGWGKTWLTTYLLLRAKSLGRKIACNYTLKGVEYKHIRTVEEAQNIRNMDIGFDEFWEWVHARTSQTKINKTMMSICLKNRKRGNSIFYNSQLPRTIDIILKEVTNYKYLPQVVEHIDGKKYVHYIARDLMGNYSDWNTIPFPLEYIGKYFDTREEPNKPNEEKTPLEEGIGLEKDFIKAFSKHSDYLNNIHLPNSGIGNNLGCDLLIITKNKKYLGVDVKGSNGKRIYYVTPKKEQLKRIRVLNNNGFIPFIAFPDRKYKRLTISKAWYLYKLHNESSILGKKNPTINNKLLKETIKLNKLHIL